jgi:hypothetical protein
MASEKLGLSPNTIRKRIRTGELRADKIVGPNGPEWRIQPPSLNGANVAQMYSTSTSSPNDTVEWEAALPASNAFPAVDTLLKVIETQTKQLEVATAQLAASTEQLKAATRVIAYQQLQLEEKESKVKLLTDSRHREGWWKKLSHRWGGGLRQA